MQEAGNSIAERRLRGIAPDIHSTRSSYRRHIRVGWQRELSRVRRVCLVFGERQPVRVRLREGRTMIEFDLALIDLPYWRIGRQRLHITSRVCRAGFPGSLAEDRLVSLPVGGIR